MTEIKPRVVIRGMKSFVPIMTTRDVDKSKKNDESKILGDLLTTDQTRYIAPRITINPSTSRADYNRLESLKMRDGKKVNDDEAKRVSRLKTGLSTLRKSYPDSVLEPRWSGTIFMPNTTKYAARPAGLGNDPDYAVDLKTLSTVGDELYN